MRYNPLFFKKIGFAGLNLNGGETIKSRLSFGKKKARGNLYNFSQGKKFGGDRRKIFCRRLQK